MEDFDWTQLEREAREQAMALEDQPLEIGQHVAWTECSYGKTDGLSITHRVAVAEGLEPETFCGEKIPEPVRRLILTAGWVRSQPRCRWCEQGYAQSTHMEVAS